MTGLGPVLNDEDHISKARVDGSVRSDEGCVAQRQEVVDRDVHLCVGAWHCELHNGNSGALEYLDILQCMHTLVRFLLASKGRV